MTNNDLDIYSSFCHHFPKYEVPLTPTGKSTDKPTNIYAMKDRRGRTRYVGKTVMTLHKRKKCHTKQAVKNPKHHVHLWIKKMLEEGTEPEIVLLEVVPPHGPWWIAEADWIERHLMYGCDLTNSTAGGDGPGRFSDEARQKMSNSKKGKPRSQIALINQSIAGLPHHNTGRHHSAESRKKQSRTRTGRSLSPEHVIAIKEGLDRHYSDPNYEAKPFTDDHRKKLRNSAKRRPPQSQETKSKRINTLLQLNAIPENKEKHLIAVRNPEKCANHSLFMKEYHAAKRLAKQRLNANNDNQEPLNSVDTETA